MAFLANAGLHGCVVICVVMRGHLRAFATGAHLFDARERLAYAARPMTDTERDRRHPPANPPRGPRLPTARAYQEAAPRMPEQGLDLGEVFPGCDTIEIEIGFGRGQFLFERRDAAPDVGLLGIEIRAKHAYLVAERCQRLNLPGMRILGGDARLLLPLLRPEGSVARVMMSFPDPWWKKRHADRRLMDEPLLAAIARLLRPGGELFVQTDVEERAQQYLERIGAHPAFERVTDSGFIEDNPYGARSNREHRAIADGLPIYRMLFRRKESA